MNLFLGETVLLYLTIVQGDTDYHIVNEFNLPYFAPSLYTYNSVFEEVIINWISSSSIMKATQPT
jgi:hypothetical protein